MTSETRPVSAHPGDPAASAGGVGLADDDPTTMIITDLPIDHIETEDDTPVDNLASAKQQRLLVEPLYSSHPLGERVFLADANVGLFAALYQPPLVPDAFLSLDVRPHPNWWEKRHRSYFFWEFGKPPEVVIEIVSNRKGGEASDKFAGYGRMRIFYYAVFDPQRQLGDQTLQVYELRSTGYHELPNGWMPMVSLGLTLWRGAYEDVEEEWLRWCDQAGNVIPTGAERAAEAETALQQERQRADELAARLAAMEAELRRLRDAG